MKVVCMGVGGGRMVKRGGERETFSGERAAKARAGAELGAGTQLDTDGTSAGLCLPDDGLPGALPLPGWPKPLPHVTGRVPPPPTPALGCLGH